MDVKKRFATDRTLELDGVWVQIDKDARVKIARRDNPRYREVLRRESAPYRQAARAGMLSDETAEQILIKVLAETVVLDWEGFTENGKPLPYSKENAVRLLTELKDFLDFVVSASAEAELFKAQADEADAKNSSTP